MRSSLSKRRRQITAMMKRAAPLVCVNSDKQQKCISHISTTVIDLAEAGYTMQCVVVCTNQ